MSVNVHPLRAKDLAAILPLEQSNHAHPWTLGNFEDAFKAGYHAEGVWETSETGQSPSLRGYYFAMPVLDESHLLNLTIDKNQRRQGHGRRLMQAWETWSRSKACRTLWLELRASNHPALALYTQHGFSQVGQRKGYYPSTRTEREDALVLSKTLY